MVRFPIWTIIIYPEHLIFPSWHQIAVDSTALSQSVIGQTILMQIFYQPVLRMPWATYWGSLWRKFHQISSL